MIDQIDRIADVDLAIAINLSGRDGAWREAEFEDMID
jgi:hypothetical protein